MHQQHSPRLGTRHLFDKFDALIVGGLISLALIMGMVCHNDPDPAEVVAPTPTPTPAPTSTALPDPTPTLEPIIDDFIVPPPMGDGGLR